MTSLEQQLKDGKVSNEDDAALQVVHAIREDLAELVDTMRKKLAKNHYTRLTVTSPLPDVAGKPVEYTLALTNDGQQPINGPYTGLPQVGVSIITTYGDSTLTPYMQRALETPVDSLLRSISYVKIREDEISFII